MPLKPYGQIVNSPEFAAFKSHLHEQRNTIKRCPCCNSNIADRKVALYRGLINALFRAYVWCGKNGRHEFDMEDIRATLTKSDYARFGDLVRFGGIVYKPEGKRHYGINMARARAFFRGEYKIPVQLTIDQITAEIVAATYVSISEFPDITALLNENGVYDYEKVITAPIDTALQAKRGLPPVAQLAV